MAAPANSRAQLRETNSDEAARLNSSIRPMPGPAPGMAWVASIATVMSMASPEPTCQPSPPSMRCAITASSIEATK